MPVWDKIQSEFNKGNSPVRKLIIINFTLFLLSGLVLMVGRGTSQETQANALLKLFYAPADFSDLLSKPWSMLTYMFFHSLKELRHVLINMAILYFIGRILMDFQSNKKFYWLYFGGGIAGALMYQLAFLIFPNWDGLGGPLLGASAGVMSIVVATALLVPNYELTFFRTFKVKVKWIALFMFGLDLLYLTVSNQGGHLAHLGGALFGSAFILNEQGRLNLSIFQQIKNPFKPRFTVVDEREILRGEKEKVKAEANVSSKPSTRSNNVKPRQEEIDAILDKINQSGYPSLTTEEKDLLFRASDK
jgi:membrane associated rhomboid family serine protease